MSVVKFVILVGLGFYLITCLAIIDIARKDFKSIYEKLIWGIIAFIPFFGCFIYFIFGFRRGLVKNGNNLSKL